MSEQQIKAFIEDRHAETVFLIQEISNTDTDFMFDVYTRNQRNARQALLDLREAIDTLLMEWNRHSKLPPASADSEKVDYAHSGVRWPLKIIRTPATSH
jgi:hypothetical protein